MRKWGLIATALLAAAPGFAKPPVALKPENAARLSQVGAAILFWSQAQRDANFPHMEEHFPGTTAKASPHPYPLRPGKPLKLDGVDAFMTANNTAGLIVVQDGRIRLERYARGYSRAGRYTSFSVAKSLTSTLVGATIRDGFIKSVDDPVTRYIPDLAGSTWRTVTPS